jgi:hypothetical protein
MTLQQALDAHFEVDDLDRRCNAVGELGPNQITALFRRRRLVLGVAVAGVLAAIVAAAMVAAHITPWGELLLLVGVGSALAAWLTARSMERSVANGRVRAVSGPVQFNIREGVTRINVAGESFLWPGAPLAGLSDLRLFVTVDGRRLVAAEALPAAPRAGTASDKGMPEAR